MMAEKEASYGHDVTHVESAAPANPEFSLAADNEQLQRGLKSRHIQFLALGE